MSPEDQAERECWLAQLDALLALFASLQNAQELVTKASDQAPASTPRQPETHSDWRRAA